MNDTTNHIKRAALKIGFSAVGIAKVEIFDSEFNHFEEWLARGFHADLGYMSRNSEKRRDIREILPSAKSVIVLSQNYFTPFEHENSETSGKISRYAWGDDYHDVIPPKLEKLRAVLREIDPECETKIYTDTGAVLEKQWAVRAGIGWQGKHSNIISREIGSWFFIGVIITSTELICDEPQEDFCGTCTACISACPTSAIVEPFVVDAGKCLSYWTIEAKPEVEIPTEIAKNMNGWIFGCDICQDVCPWNRFEKPTQESRFLPRNNETSLEFRAIAEFSQEKFSARFQKSPIKRAKWKGLQRNAKSADENS